MFKKYIQKCVNQIHKDINIQIRSFFDAQNEQMRLVQFNNEQAAAHNKVIITYAKEIRDALLYLVEQKK